MLLPWKLAHTVAKFVKLDSTQKYSSLKYNKSTNFCSIMKRGLFSKCKTATTAKDILKTTKTLKQEFYFNLRPLSVKSFVFSVAKPGQNDRYIKRSLLVFPEERICQKLQTK